MPGAEPFENGVASLAYVPGIARLYAREVNDVDGRDEPGHDAFLTFADMVEPNGGWRV